MKDATTYAAQVDTYLADPRFARQMLSYFQDAFKMGGPAVTTTGSAHPSFDTAPTYATELVVNDQPITNLFTGTTNTCPTLNTHDGRVHRRRAARPPTASRRPACSPTRACMSKFYSNMAMRRARWIAGDLPLHRASRPSISATPVAMGNGQYVSPCPFTSITGGADPTVAPINFQDTSAVMCANCHTTINHIAPLFAQFDAQGAFQTTIQVEDPGA